MTDPTYAAAWGEGYRAGWIGAQKAHAPAESHTAAPAAAVGPTGGPDREIGSQPIKCSVCLGLLERRWVHAGCPSPEPDQESGPQWTCLYHRERCEPLKGLCVVDCLPIGED